MTIKLIIAHNFFIFVDYSRKYIELSFQNYPFAEDHDWLYLNIIKKIQSNFSNSNYG